MYAFKEAPEELVLLFWNDLYAYAYNRVHNVDDACDVCQETVTDALANINNFREMGYGIKPWLLKIAKAKVGMYFQDKKRHSYVSIDCVDDIHCETKKDENINLECLDILSEDQMRVFTLRCLDDFPRDQIAEQLKLPIQKVDRLLRDAKSRLRGLYLREHIQ
ncbi:RNA polymerase sigma factor [Planctomycetota bacterium]